MFVHRAKIQLKPDSFISLSRKIERDIMPALRLLKDFCSGVTSIDTSWSTAIEETHWKTKEAAEAYELAGFPEIEKMISEIIIAKSVTSIFEVTCRHDGK